MDGVLDALQLIKSTQTEQLIRAFIILPLELQCLENKHRYAVLKSESYAKFMRFHLRQDVMFEPEHVKAIEELTEQIERMKSLQIAKSDSDQTSSQVDQMSNRLLRPLLNFIRSLLREVSIPEHDLPLMQRMENHETLVQKCDTIVGLLMKGSEMFLPLFNNIIGDLFIGAAHLVSNLRLYMLSIHLLKKRLSSSDSIGKTVVNMQYHS